MVAGIFYLPFVKEYVHWMTYWIVLAMTTIIEEITDVVFSCWFPFYIELKLLFLLWLISPVTRYSNEIRRRDD